MSGGGFSPFWLRSSSFTHVYALSFLLVHISGINDDLTVCSVVHVFLCGVDLRENNMQLAAFILQTSAEQFTIISCVSQMYAAWYCGLTLMWCSQGHIELPTLFNKLNYIFLIKKKSMGE